MKKQFVIASSLITQMAHLGQAAAHSANPELQNQLANYLKEEAQKPASAQSSRTYQSDADGGVVVIKKLRSPFRHIAKRTNFAAKMNISAQMTSSSDTGNNNTSSSSNVVNTSSSEVTNPPVTSSSSEVSPAPATPPVVVAPTAPTSSSDVSPQPGPTSSSDSNQNTSSSSQQNPPTTSSSARCAKWIDRLAVSAAFRFR